MAVADIHGSGEALPSILRKIELHKPDVVLVAGDITHFGPAAWAREFLDAIPVKTLAVPGNCDPPEVVDAIKSSQAVSLHQSGVEIGGVVFAGMGGSSPTPFPTLFQIAEEDIRNGLEGKMARSSVLLTHSPPRGHLDRTFIGTHVGSTAIAEVVERFRPLLVVCGHIHEARGFERDDHTLFVNPGKAARGYAALIELGPARAEVELLEGR